MKEGKGVVLLVAAKGDADLVAKFREVGLANSDQFNFALLADAALVEGATAKSVWIVKGDEKTELVKEATKDNVEKSVSDHVEASIPLVGPVNEEN